MQPVLEKHSVALRSDEPVLVEGDDTRLEQVLQNLLDNAIKYSPEGGEILVEVARRGGARVHVGKRSGDRHPRSVQIKPVRAILPRRQRRIA